MNLDDQLPGVRMNLHDERLRAAGNALREGSATWSTPPASCGRSSTPAAWRLRTRLRPFGEPVAPAPAGPPRRTRRLALAVNLVLVLVLGVVVGVVGARPGQERRRLRPEPTGQHRRRHQHPHPRNATRTLVQVPEACLDAADLADEVISRLNRNDRDNGSPGPAGLQRRKKPGMPPASRTMTSARRTGLRAADSSNVGDPQQDLLGDLLGELDRVAVGHHLHLGDAEGGVRLGGGHEPIDVHQGRDHREQGLVDAVVVAALGVAVGPQHVQPRDVLQPLANMLQASA